MQSEPPASELPEQLSPGFLKAPGLAPAIVMDVMLIDPRFGLCTVYWTDAPAWPMVWLPKSCVPGENVGGNVAGGLVPTPLSSETPPWVLPPSYVAISWAVLMPTDPGWNVTPTRHWSPGLSVVLSQPLPFENARSPDTVMVLMRCGTVSELVIERVAVSVLPMSALNPMSSWPENGRPGPGERARHECQRGEHDDGESEAHAAHSVSAAATRSPTPITTMIAGMTSAAPS